MRGLLAAIRFLTDHVFWRFQGDTIRRERTPQTKRPHSVTRGLLLLFDVSTGDLVALISEGHIRNLRVGAAAGLAARHLARGALGIDVNPLVVAGRFRKLVDTMLVDDHPVGDADFNALECLGILYGTDTLQTRSPRLLLSKALSDT